MDHVSTLKAQIKAWEKSFRQSHGKDPSVQDIRDNPDIAAKYKLYKKASKPPPAPSTPKKSQPSLPRPRPVETTAPLSTFNPFSPEKNKGKQKQVSSPIKKTFPNPFATPSKSKPVPRIRETSPSPPPSPSPSVTLHAPPTAVSRARKRLRGEPVSPSPNKEKRRRVHSQTTLPFPRQSADLSSSDEDAPANSFVGDSPVKASTTAKSFSMLFDEPTGSKSALSRSKTAPSGSGLFGSFSRADSEDDLDGVLGKSRKKVVNGRSIPVESKASSRSSAKRGLSESDVENEKQTSDTGLVLVPPSPPAEPSSYRPPKDGKRSNNSRKKAKLGGDESSDTEMHSGDEVKVVVGRQLRVQHAQDDDEDLESEPILRYFRPLDSIASGSQSQSERQDQGSFEVQLPDKLRDILALSSTSESKSYDLPEEKVIEGLLYGRRTTHYDPSRGGEIWGVGDSEQVDNDAKDEEDWEGEPVPWEIGEL
ncbi:hypothetical protein VKT23_003190 [Stygiomarasmius scandens]|uniref:DNA replication regulator SLD2 n=1 Tax=Marasmiellus scandens TaxID=2682957 RepID=A0ABR1JWG3_9AGAR